MIFSPSYFLHILLTKSSQGVFKLRNALTAQYRYDSTYGGWNEQNIALVDCLICDRRTAAFGASSRPDRLFHHSLGIRRIPHAHASLGYASLVLSSLSWLAMAVTDALHPTLDPGPFGLGDCLVGAERFIQSTLNASAAKRFALPTMQTPHPIRLASLPLLWNQTKRNLSDPLERLSSTGRNQAAG